MSNFFKVTDDEEQEETQLTEEETLSEVEVRLHKANYYRAVLDQQLFGEDDSEAAIEVSREFRDFALSRLRVLMGIELPPEEKQNLFSGEQVEALKVWADRLISKPTLMEAKPPPQVPTLTPVVQTPPAPKVQTVQVSAPSTKPTKKKTQAKSTKLAGRPKAEEGLPNGVKVDSVTGEKYFEVEKDAIDEFGKPFKKKVRMSINGQNKPVNDPNYKALPNPQQMEQLEHQRAMNSHQTQMGNPLIGAALNHFLKGGQSQAIDDE